jgi:hypothetical protein
MRVYVRKNDAEARRIAVKTARLPELLHRESDGCRRAVQSLR